MVQKKKCERAKNSVKTSANGQRQKTSLEETVVPAPPPGQHCREAENTVKNSTKCTFSSVSAREHPVGGNNQSGSTKVPKLYWTKCENKSHNFLSHHDYKRLQTIPSKWAKGNKITSQLTQTMHPPQKKHLHKIGSTSSHPCHVLTFLLNSETLRSHACKQYQIRSSTL